MNTPQPSLLAKNPRYAVGDDGHSIVLYDGDQPVSAILTGLTHIQAESLAQHLRFALELGAQMAITKMGRGAS